MTSLNFSEQRPNVVVPILRSDLLLLLIPSSSCQLNADQRDPPPHQIISVIAQDSRGGGWGVLHERFPIPHGCAPLAAAVNRCPFDTWAAASAAVRSGQAAVPP